MRVLFSSDNQIIMIFFDHVDPRTIPKVYENGWEAMKHVELCTVCKLNPAYWWQLSVQEDFKIYCHRNPCSCEKCHEIPRLCNDCCPSTPGTDIKKSGNYKHFQQPKSEWVSHLNPFLAKYSICNSPCPNHYFFVEAFKDPDWKTDMFYCEHCGINCWCTELTKHHPDPNKHEQPTNGRSLEDLRKYFLWIMEHYFMSLSSWEYWRVPGFSLLQHEKQFMNTLFKTIENQQVRFYQKISWNNYFSRIMLKLIGPAPIVNNPQPFGYNIYEKQVDDSCSHLIYLDKPELEIIMMKATQRFLTNLIGKYFEVMSLPDIYTESLQAHVYNQIGLSLQHHLNQRESHTLG